MLANIWVSLAVLPAALALLILASDYFLNGAISLATRFRLPEFVVGSLIVAVGTSAPELAINLVAGLEGQGDIVVSNLVGSNIVNVCLGIGVAGLFVAYGVIQRAYAVAFVLGLVGALLLLLATVLSANGSGLSVLPQWVGIGLLVVFGIHIWRSLSGEHEEASDDIEAVNRPIWISIAFLIGGCAAMAFFADMAVQSAVFISEYVGIPEAVIGATVIAAGGSLPEIFSCVAAARRKMPNIVLGNIAGSQIFNLFGILGATLLVVEVEYSTALGIDMAFLIGATVVLFALGWSGARMRGLMPYALLATYVAYGVYLVSISV
ncbi:MAG: sodium:calcium antiporter [Pseudomonadota bacterium]